MAIVASSVLLGKASLLPDLEEAVRVARVAQPDDIYILVPWMESETIDVCMGSLLRVPAAIHLGLEGILNRFMNARISKVGSISSMNLVHEPLTLSEILFRRSLDIFGAVVSVVSLAPLFLLIALAIKLDSPCSIFFFQRRYGFNRNPFYIFKFRTMRACEDGPHIAQARRDDPRVTRVGRFLRRTNLDELPQLMNVFLGDMSLVGPQPRALAHDQKFEQLIAFYARRHNVQPGMTGWAQVSGCPGETNSEEKMRKRLDCDLYYIDHWSFIFDLKILFLTVFSNKAYRNAY